MSKKSEKTKAEILTAWIENNEEFVIDNCETAAVREFVDDTGVQVVKQYYSTVAREFFGHKRWGEIVVARKIAKSTGMTAGEVLEAGAAGVAEKPAAGTAKKTANGNGKKRSRPSPQDAEIDALKEEALYWKWALVGERKGFIDRFVNDSERESL
jgi:hypothetical protein